jgi:large subunit ribosomal protein L30
MKKAHDSQQLFAVVRIRGSAKTRTNVNDAAEKLRLKYVNNCTVIPSDSSHVGMLKQAEDRLTWGEIKADVLAMLIKKRGVSEGGGKVDPKKAAAAAEKIFKAGTMKGSGVSSLFKLSPPTAGFRTIKLHYPKGDLGYRGEKINELLERMI